MHIKKIATQDLITGNIARVDYYSEKNELLIGKGTIISERHKELLARRNIFEVYCKITEIGEMIRNAESHIDPIPDGHLPPVDHHHPLYLQNYDVLENDGVSRSLDERLEHHTIIDLPQGVPLKRQASQRTFEQRTPDYLEEISSSYTRALKLTRETILSILQGNRHCQSMVTSVVREFTRLFMTDKSILLNISNYKPAENEYLFCHSLNVCILSINIAASYGYNMSQVIEVGCGALLHDIGMFLIPEQIRYKSSRLTDAEWYEIKKHPVLGINLLERVVDLAEPIIYIAYQTHERQNSSGYPKQRNDRLIHHYAKAVQVADIYEAFSTQRPHRPPLAPYAAAANLVRMAKIGLIAREFVRAFITYLSAYPVGSLVLLSDDSVAKVINGNEHEFALPQITVVASPSGRLLKRTEMYQIDLGHDTERTVRRPLAFDEYPQIGMMDGF